MLKEQIDLTGIPLIETMAHTSKGNQRKWMHCGFWYKADHMGYEGLAEYLVSSLLKKSDLTVPFVEYTPIEIRCNNRTYNGCKSRNFLPEQKSIIPLEKLFRQYTGRGIIRCAATLPF